MKYAYSLLRDGVIYQRNRKVLFTVKDLQESETEGEIKSLALFWLKSFNCIIPIHKSGEGKGQSYCWPKTVFCFGCVCF